MSQAENDAAKAYSDVQNNKYDAEKAKTSSAYRTVHANQTKLKNNL